MSTNSFQQWPAEQLESVDSCPVCGSTKRKNLESGLVDWMSNPSTGPWEMKNCLQCRVAFLSPRPLPESISFAYAHYYTHTSAKDDLVDSRLRQFRNFFAEKYYKAAFGSKGLLENGIYLLLRILVPFSSYLDSKSRHLFQLVQKPGRLLDVGCGNGEFLKFARNHGWDVTGIDFDEKAITEAGSSGLDVRLGSIEVIDSEEKFDFICLSHVIEHVYDPAEFVRSCYSRLNDGGVLWLETPNIEGFGNSIYKSNWRGLEPPRHLILFNREAISELSLKMGFVSVKQKLHGLSGLYMGLSSERLLNNTSPCGSLVSCITRKLAMLLRVSFLELAQMFSKRRREFLTIIAVK